MADANMLWIWLICFTVFTVIVGAGLQFYQVQVEASKHYDVVDPLFATMQQGAAIAITLLFMAAAILFMGAAIRYVDKGRE